MAAMRNVLILLAHVIATVVRLVRPGGIRSVIAESALLRHQFLVLNRPRQRAPDLRPVDRAYCVPVAYFALPLS